MDFASLIPPWLNAFFIAPFRWTDSVYWAMWLGTAPLALYCTVIGEYTGALLFLAHNRYFAVSQDDMVRYHNLSVAALHAGDKEAYLAANTMAREAFGKTFFAQASCGLASLWPVPFALGWMSLHFEGIAIYTLPGTNVHAGYVFILLTLYIAIRIIFSRCKRFLPLFGRVAAVKREAKQARGVMRPFFTRPGDTPPSIHS